jgi:hypothetical protein
MKKNEKKSVGLKPVIKHAPIKTNPNESGISELIKSNVYLYQYCRDLENQVMNLQLNMTSMFHNMMFLRHENNEIKGVLDVVMMNMGIDKKVEQMMEEKKQKKQKSLPIHDDLLVNCQACNTVHHKELKTCPKCGLKKATKESQSTDESN